MRRRLVVALLAAACARPPRAVEAPRAPPIVAAPAVEAPSLGAPLVLQETKREVSLAPVAGGFPDVIIAADGVHMLGRVHEGWMLMPEKHLFAGEHFVALDFSPDGRRLLVQMAGAGSFDVVDVASTKLVARVEGRSAGWMSSGRLAFLDPASRIVRADPDAPAQRTTGALIDCGTTPKVVYGSGDCRLAFASESEALFYAMSYAVPRLIVREHGPTELTRSWSAIDPTRETFRFAVGPTGVACVSRQSPRDAFAPGKPLAVPTEISCAPPPWDRFEVVMRGDYYDPDLQVLADAVLVSFVAEPELRVYSPTIGTPKHHCLARWDTHQARCNDDPRLAMRWRVLPDGKTAVVESNPPKWPRPLILDLEAGTFSPFGAPKEYGGVEPIDGRSDAFAIGLDGETGEGDRVMLMAHRTFGK